MTEFLEDHSRVNYLNKHRGLKLALLVMLLVLALVLGAGTYAAAKLQRPYKQEAQAKEVSITKGMDTRQIASTLEREQIVNDDKLFLYYVTLKGAAGKMQAGKYQLSAGMTIPEIVERLTQGKVISNEVRVRIGEGWNIERIAEVVEKEGLGSKDSFYSFAGSVPSEGGQPFRADLRTRYNFLANLPENANLEGYLFPDTYIVSREGGAEELVHKSLQNFDRQAGELLHKEAEAQGKSVHELVTMASVIEREVGRNVQGRALSETELREIGEERLIVSDVFWSRLELGMPLQSDATISYATGIDKSRAAFADLQYDSPYNTYLHTGLPIGPIANPGLASIRAAISPADTPYLYFLSSKEGKAYFGKSLQEHAQNREKYLGK